MRRLRLLAARHAPRAIALSTALCVLAAPLFAVQHEASVRHILCVDHGELVDAAPLTAAELAAPEHHHSRAVVEDSSRAKPAGEDVHCLVASWSHERAAAAAEQSQALPAPQAESRPLAAVPDRRPSAIPLVQLAPKLSPPRA